MTDLYWLPEIPDWRARVRSLGGAPEQVWDGGVALANARLNFSLTKALDDAVRRAVLEAPPGLATKPVRLAVLTSCTAAHLHPAIRVGGLRRGIWIDTYENDFGQVQQELSDPESALHAFAPTVVLIALDAHHLCAGITAAMDADAAAGALQATMAMVRNLWTLARTAFNCAVIQQIPLPVHLPVMGGNEHRLPGSKAAFIAALAAELRVLADSDGVDVLSLDTRVMRDGIKQWHDPIQWHNSKQEIALTAAPLYGDLVARLLAARQGRSFKCMVLDLDNTLWGGVVGDDGIEGLQLGQGSALGEAFVGFQSYAKELSHRGVILAVCSKNDEANAVEPFDKHPDMVLKRDDIASFFANWSDKASNIRAIAAELNIGLDSLVFVDDNPFERNLVRQELPMVAVPEVSDDPVYYAQTIADAGYFEALAVTDDDRKRAGQYQSNQIRQALKASATDLGSYLQSLEMRLLWKRFDSLGLKRIVQLINKSNQYNLTTRRYGDEDVQAVMSDPLAFGLQLRLIDKLGDNGVIAIVIGRLQDNQDLLIDTWLMSCRVLGRQVELATLNLLAQEALKLNAKRLIGQYFPTAKNAMVREHYAKLGFTHVETDAAPGTRGVLDLPTYQFRETAMTVVEA